MTAPLPVKDFKRAADLMAHYAVVNQKIWSPPALKVKRIARKHTRWVTSSMIARMRDLRATGESYQDIASKCGCHRTTVAVYAHDIPPPPGGFKIGRHTPTLPREEILKCFHGGFSYADIDRRFNLRRGIAWKVVSRMIRERARPRGPIDRIVRLVVAVTRVGWIQLARSAARSTKGSQRLGRARHILFWLIRRELPKTSYLVMARELGGFDHTSCIYGVKRVERAVTALGIDPAMPAVKIARLLWKLDWPERTA